MENAIGLIRIDKGAGPRPGGGQVWGAIPPPLPRTYRYDAKANPFVSDSSEKYEAMRRRARFDRAGNASRRSRRESPDRNLSRTGIYSSCSIETDDKPSAPDR